MCVPPDRPAPVLWFLIVLVLLLSDHDRSAGVVALVYLLVRLVRGVRAFRRGRGLGDEAFWNDAFRLLGRYSRTSGAEAGGAADALVSMLAAYGIPSSEIDRSLHAWREGREASAAEVAGASERLRRAAPRHGLGARLFAELALRQHARARGSAPVDAELEALLGALGLHPLEFQTIHARILLEEEWRRMAEGFGRPGGTPPPPRAPSAEAYATLGVRPEASDEEVTLAYRRLLRRHHPDKLAASGASELALRMANERTQKIRAAYEEIRAARSRAV